MKQRLVVLLIVILGTQLHAQDSLKYWKLGVTTALGPPPAFNGDYALHAGVSGAYGKHEVYAGAFVIHEMNDSVGYFPGFDAGYRIYPNGTGKIFQLFFSYDFQYFHLHTELPVTGTVPHPDVVVEDFLSVQNYGGFGFRANIIKNLFFTTHVAVGVGKTAYEFYLRWPDGHTVFDRSWNGTIDFTGRFSLTYHFLSFKK